MQDPFSCPNCASQLSGISKALAAMFGIRIRCKACGTYCEIDKWLNTSVGVAQLLVLSFTYGKSVKYQNYNPLWFFGIFLVVTIFLVYKFSMLKKSKNQKFIRLS